MTALDFTPIETLPGASALRTALRAFLEPALAGRSARERARSWSAFDAEFSHSLGKRGWIGVTWPERYGGVGASQRTRYVIVEELLAAGAPVAAHWFADRQSGAMLLRHASEAQKLALLPAMAAGSLYSCIGMSEPGSGSDLASIRTRATPVDDGWRVTGSKIWTTHAQHSHIMIALVRTADSQGNRHEGLSQLMIDLAAPGVTVRPIEDQSGDSHFAEVFFDEVFVPADMLLGVAGNGWQQVNGELSLERSGPERYLSSHRLIEETVSALADEPPPGFAAMIGTWAAELWVLRQMSLSVAAKLDRGEDPVVEAAVVKDLGARFEQAVPRALLAAWDDSALDDSNGAVRETMNHLLAASPAFSLRGGTREILRGIIARGLGLR